jgi:leader peptidase (prepilin peptidase)/N-methyltransferase
MMMIIIAAIVGLIIGSFINVVIYRLPLILQQDWKQQCSELLKQPAVSTQHISLWSPRSHCPQCKTAIRCRDNIPLISFLWRRGKCANCSHQISWRYPLVELLCALLAGYSITHFGVNWQGFAATVFSWSLVALIFIDLEEHILPDEITLGLLWLGLIASVFGLFAPPVDAIIGAASGYLSLWIIGWVYKKIRKREGIGFGDYKLFAAAGAWVGWQMLPFVILIASALGVIVAVALLLRKKIQHHTPIPFGPYLAIAAWIAMFYGDHLVNIYLNFFSNMQ